VKSKVLPNPDVVLVMPHEVASRARVYRSNTMRVKLEGALIGEFCNQEWKSR
jgi:hypothetical protein